MSDIEGFITQVIIFYFILLPAMRLPVLFDRAAMEGLHAKSKTLLSRRPFSAVDRGFMADGQCDSCLSRI